MGANQEASFLSKPHLFPEMEAATSTMQHSYSLGPHGPNPPHGAQQAQRPHQPAAGPPGAPHPEEPHHKPFFYIQPPQSYLPMQGLQWPVPMPMPVSYNPYYGYSGLGYGMSMMPNYQPNPYVEPPGFVMPHTHLHLMDYRRMLNPQYYQTMAYHSRRFRYQHNSQGREMTSSEVQTEPLTQRTSTPGSGDAAASRCLPVHSNTSPSVPSSPPCSSALAVPKGDHALELKDLVPPSSTARTPPNGSFVIQTEEVRIECRSMPVGLQLLHSCETAEVSHSFSQDMMQCSSVPQGPDKALCLPADRSEQALQGCPDILLVGTPTSSEKIQETDPATANIDSQAGDAQEMHELNATAKKLHCIAHLPFDHKYLDELRKMESTVWSVEETLTPSSESLIQTDCTGVTVREEMPLLAAEELEDTVDVPGGKMMFEAGISSIMDVPAAEETTMTELTAVDHAPYLLMLDKSPLKARRNQRILETNVQDHQDTSFESLPAYLPSTSWLADYDNVYYCSKLPSTPKKQNRPVGSQGLDVPSRRRKLELEYKEQPAVRKPKERYKPKGKQDRRSLSDHECCLSRNFNENAFTPYGSKRDRLCTRCLAKSRICRPASPGLDGRTLKRKAFQQKNEALFQTCEACKSHPNKQLRRKGSIPDLRARPHDTEGESSENSSRAKWRAADLKRPLTSKQNLVTRPAAVYPKLREKNCACDESQHPAAAWERPCLCPHGNAIREMDENSAVPVPLQDPWRNVDKIYLTHRWQTEKSWKAVTPKPDADASKNQEAKSRHFNKHKKSQSQGTRRKDTRC